MKKEIMEATQLIKAASECIDRANAKLEAIGVVAISNPLISSYYDEKEVEYHIFSGILNLVDNPEDIKPMPPMFRSLGLAPDDQKGWIKIDGVNFFQSKDIDADKMILR